MFAFFIIGDFLGPSSSCQHRWNGLGCRSPSKVNKGLVNQQAVAEWQIGGVEVMSVFLRC